MAGRLHMLLHGLYEGLPCCCAWQTNSRRLPGWPRLSGSPASPASPAGPASAPAGRPAGIAAKRRREGSADGPSPAPQRLPRSAGLTASPKGTWAPADSGPVVRSFLPESRGSHARMFANIGDSAAASPLEPRRPRRIIANQHNLGLYVQQTGMKFLLP